MRMKELLEREVELRKELRGLQTKAENEKRDLSWQENDRADDILSELESIQAKIERNSRIHQVTDKKNLERALMNGAFDAPAIHRSGDSTALRRYMQTGDRHEVRALGTGTGGGVLAPDHVHDKFQSVLKAYSGVLQGASIVTTQDARDFPIPVFDNTSNEGVVVAENTELTTEHTPSVDDKSLGAFAYDSGIYKLSYKAIATSEVDLERYLAEAIGEAVGRKLNKDLTNGNGSGGCTGIMDATSGASDSGIVTAAGDIDYGDLVDLMHAIDPAYREREGRKVAKWMISDSAFKVVRKMTDSNGRPLWVATDGRFSGQILGHDVIVNNNMAAFGTGNSPILFGDISRYWVRQTPLELMRLEEKYAEYLQVGFHGFTFCDGKLTDQSAVKYLTIG